ncbi:MAG TPA: hypothetical protein DCR10_11960 [Acidimicrobiaceae bacterium]|nr:hypothetical protein [Acidimicrobiaceae bacterium]
MMADVSKKLMGQFAGNLSELIASSEAAADPRGDAEDVAKDLTTGGEVAEDGAAVRAVDAPSVEAVDLLDAAGASVLKRLVPTLLVVAAVILVILLLV